MADRPMVNVYEPDDEGVEQLVFRPMNDEEYAVWEADRAVEAPAPVNPVIEAVRSMSDEDRAALRELLAV